MFIQGLRAATRDINRKAVIPSLYAYEHIACFYSEVLYLQNPTPIMQETKAASICVAYYYVVNIDDNDSVVDSNEWQSSRSFPLHFVQLSNYQLSRTPGLETLHQNYVRFDVFENIYEIRILA